MHQVNNRSRSIKGHSGQISLVSPHQKSHYSLTVFGFLLDILELNILSSFLVLRVFSISIAIMMVIVAFMSIAISCILCLLLLGYPTGILSSLPGIPPIAISSPPFGTETTLSLLLGLWPLVHTSPFVFALARCLLVTITSCFCLSTWYLIIHCKIFSRNTP